MNLLTILILISFIIALLGALGVTFGAGYIILTVILGVATALRLFARNTV